jgi:hypothetical protein
VRPPSPLVQAKWTCNQCPAKKGRARRHTAFNNIAILKERAGVSELVLAVVWAATSRVGIGRSGRRRTDTYEGNYENGRDECEEFHGLKGMSKCSARKWACTLG